MTSIAAAACVGLVLGGGLARNPKLRTLLGLLVAPTLKRVFAAAG